MNELRVTRLLLVEDDDDDYILARDYISEIPFLDISIERATNVEDALSALSRETFDLCLVDYRLGAMTGIDLLKSAKENGFSSPIIMLTSQSDEELDQIALDAGAADYLVKGELNAAQFARSIRYALARRDVESERVERVKAEQEVQAKDRFLAHLSHELRTPLTAILGYTEILLHTDAEHQTELEVIHRNGKHLLNLLNDVLDLSKIAANKLELLNVDVDINALLADVYTLMRMAAIDKGLQLNIHAPNLLPKSIKADPTRLRQILINLISNAVKFTDKGHVDITVSCSSDGVDNALIFMVQDSGIGISQVQIEQIFKPFVQVADVVTRSTGGSGLGLAISNELVRRMGGNIRVTSQLNQGSCFSVRIPIDADSDQTRVPLDVVAHAEAPSPLSDAPTLAGHVLVADDLRDIRTLIGHLISRLGPEVHFARDGQEALQKIASHQDAKQTELQPFDVIFMDIHMPIMDGVSAVKRIRATGIKTPVVALTAANMKGSREHFLTQGFNDVLSKPVDATLLTRTIKQYLPAKSENVARADNIDAPSHQKHALIVEDDADAAQAISALLQALGTHTHIEATPQGAIQALKSDTPWSHVFLDLHLGQDDGLTVADYIQLHRAKLKIVIMSGADLNPSTQNKYQFYATLKKPIQLSELSNLFT